MVIRVVEFSSGGTKLVRFLPKNQHIKRKLLNFENWCKVSKSAKIRLSKLNFYIKNHWNLSQFFYIEEYQYNILLLSNFDTINF